MAYSFNGPERSPFSRNMACLESSIVWEDNVPDVQADLLPPRFAAKPAKYRASSWRHLARQGELLCRGSPDAPGRRVWMHRASRQSTPTPYLGLLRAIFSMAEIDF